MKNINSILNIKAMSFLLLFAVIVAEGCTNTEANTEAEQSKGIPVKVVKLEEEYVSFPIHISGNISTTKESRLSFKTGGIIESTLVDEGDKIKKGQVLAKLNLKEIQEQVNQANIYLEKSQRDYERIYNLYTDTVTTLEKYQNAKSALDIVQTNLNIAEYNMQHSIITAPSDGVILDKFFEENEIVGIGNPIFNFASIENAWRLFVGMSDKDIESS